jgi:ABC-type uncharacterized transport system involved in gliding motility auxiliary subunit
MIERLIPYLRAGCAPIALIGAATLLIALGGLLVLGTSALWIEIMGGIGLALLAAAALARPSQFVALLTGRQARYGGNAALMTVALIAILGLTNHIGVRYHWRWDVTEEKQFSLSEQTLSLLYSLEEPVHVTLFFTPMHYNRQQAEDLIQEYALHGKTLDYTFIDPDLDRRVALEYQIARDGTIVFERGHRRQIAFGVQEQDLTSALLQVIRDEKRGVFFLTGHQERDPLDFDELGYSLMKQFLESENYVVDTLNLAATATPPPELDVLVIAGPQQPLGAAELSRLRSFVEQGVSLLVLVEPGMEDPLDGMLRDYGLELPDTLILDPIRSFFGDIAAPLVDRYEFHQITKDMSGLTSVFPLARALQLVEPAPEEWLVQVLAFTSETAWAETDYRSEQTGRQAGDLGGPLPIAVAIEPLDSESGNGRLVVIGNASFCENGLLNQIRGIGNVDLFMNAVGWLAEDDALISIRPKWPLPRHVILTPPQARAIIYTNILFVPFLVLLAGGVVWWRRR